MMQPVNSEEVAMDELYNKFLRQKHPNYQKTKEFLQNENVNS
jgi:hypothetical protein